VSITTVFVVVSVCAISGRHRSVAVMDEFAKRVISGRRRTLEALEKSEPAGTPLGGGGEFESSSRLGPDLLSRFLEDAAKKDAADKSTSSTSAAEDKAEARTGGSDQELRDIVLNFMIAGRDTTACALSWTLFELAKCPEAQQKLRAEFDAAVPFPTDTPAPCTGGDGSKEGSKEANKGSGVQDVSYEAVATLSYAHAVALEVLRLHPSVPKDLKVAVRADTLPCGTKIPAGCTVMWSPYAMGRDARYWADPLAFDPGRFLAASEGGEKSGGQRVAEPSVFQYATFNAGPRLCLGKPLALLEIKLVTNLLLRAFDFSLAAPHAGGYVSTLVLPLKPGLEVHLIPRAAP
jgi:cytochrome P450